MKKFIILSLSLISTTVLAANADLTWVYPTTNTDGTTIPASGAGSIASTKVEWGTCSGTAFGTKSGEAAVPAPTKTYQVTNLGVGTWCFRANVSNTYGATSDWSGVVSKVVPPPTPNPPTLTVTIPVAYEINLTPSGFVKLGRDVGSVPIGTACSEDIVVANNRATYYAVPRNTVTLYRQPKSSVLVAECHVS